MELYVALFNKDGEVPSNKRTNYSRVKIDTNDLVIDSEGYYVNRNEICFNAPNCEDWGVIKRAALFDSIEYGLIVEWLPEVHTERPIKSMDGGPRIMPTHLKFYLSAPVIIDIPRMEEALKGPFIKLPQGLTRDEMIKFICDSSKYDFKD